MLAMRPHTSSFDVTTSVDLQEVDNAVNQARKEIAHYRPFARPLAANVGGFLDDPPLSMGEDTDTALGGRQAFRRTKF